jgi:hypothetical protein
VTPNLGGKPSKNQQWEKPAGAGRRPGVVTAPATPPTLDDLLAGLTDEDLEE